MRPVSAGRGRSQGCVALGDLLYFSEPQWYVCKSRGGKRRCWISGRCHPTGLATQLHVTLFTCWASLGGFI